MLPDPGNETRAVLHIVYFFIKVPVHVKDVSLNAGETFVMKSQNEASKV